MIRRSPWDTGMEGAIDQIDAMSVNTIRILAADAIQKAKSGHLGLPLGAAAVPFELWAKYMNHSSKNPEWENRDRFVLPGGHDSTLLYPLSRPFGYSLIKEDMMNFRQMDSLTPGHPGYGHTVGIEATAGPLGADMGMAAGMAMAESHLAAVFDKDRYSVADHLTYVLDGDGCMMEGISPKAFSLAGTLGLSKFIVFYNSNRISTEGSTDIAFTEDVRERIKASRFQLVIVKDGNDLDATGKAIKEVKTNTTRPSFIIVKTQIDCGCLTEQGKASTHGEPLGDNNVKAMGEFLNWPSMEFFYVPDEVYANYKTYTERGTEAEEKWNTLFTEYCGKCPEMKELWDKFYNPNLVSDIYDSKDCWAFEGKLDATRGLSGEQLQKLKNLMPSLTGGAADLAPSIKTYMTDMGDFSKDNHAGRDLHLGARELATPTIRNDLMFRGGLRVFVSTFFVFSDCIKPMTRLSALMGMPLTYVFTRDSADVGEDGSTRKPIEQLAMLRAMPNFHVYRPVDTTEIAAVQCNAVFSKKASIALVLIRQNLSQLAGSSKEALKGACILEGPTKGVPDAIIIVIDSEVELAVGAKVELAKEGVDVRAVSMPSMNVFEEQLEDHREKVLPKAMRERVTVGALGDFGWGRYVGPDGTTVTMRGFGANTPTGQLFGKFGSTVEDVVAAVKLLQT